VLSPDPTLIAALGRALSSGPPLRLAVLFGSRGRGAPRRPQSDVDVGIVPASPALSDADELAMTAALSTAAGLEVDLVRLDRDEPLLYREVALHGTCLHEDAPGVFAAWRADAVSRFIDFEETIAPHRDRFLERLAGAHPR
jgi:predicted nucleotidyltransferase